MRLALFAIMALLTACGGEHAQTIVEKPVIQYVEKPVACPSPAERARLKALRPKPLRSQLMPPTKEERVAKTAAQLGRYEAPGGYADQVDAALDRCQQP